MVVNALDVSGNIPRNNEDLAQRLEEAADVLDAQHANAFRVRAYRVAAGTIRGLSEPITEILAREQTEGLMKLPGIGRSLARSIERLSRTGQLPLLDHLRPEARSEKVLATVPGIGRRTAVRIRQELGISTLSELEAAAYDGRLAAMSGMGAKKVRAVRESLAGRFQQPSRPARRPPTAASDPPPISDLLDIDEEYRRKAAEDRLLRIAPHRFNPAGAAWLPILQTQRGGRRFTAMFSNTARAHELETTHDWVVIYREHHAGQWTVITSRFGRLKGRRVVRGREAECLEYYRTAAVPPG